MKLRRTTRGRMRLSALAGAAMLAGRTALAQEPAPQQSTTGPIPPPGAGQGELSPAGKSTMTISGVPPYLWRHGCGPTAVGMVLGYYDSNGFPDLFAGDASTQTTNVNQGIASQGSGMRGSGTQLHYEDYALPDDEFSQYVIPDSSETYPTNCHASDSIADFMRTSWSSEGNFYGWSWTDHIIPAFTNYVRLRNIAYSPRSTLYYVGFNPVLTWAVVTNEIANNRPMVFMVDSDQDGEMDHFVPVIGCDDGPPQRYACYDTWITSIQWYQFRAMSTAYAYGVWGGWTFSLASTATNTPPVVQSIYAKQTATNGAGAVTLTNKVSDINLDYCQVQVSFSTNAGANWTNAWIQSASAVYGTVAISNQAARQLSGVATKNGSTAVTNTLTVVWSTTNSPAVAFCTNTIVRCQGWDGASLSAVVTSAPFLVDNQAPVGPSNLWSSTHTTNVWSTNRTIAVRWSRAGDGKGVGVQGYGYAFTNAWPAAAPAVFMTTATNATSGSLADGSNWWFVVRACDSNGNWGASTGSGPYRIDAAAPTCTVARCGASPTNAVSVQFTVDFSENVTNFTVGDVALSGTAPGKVISGFATNTPRNFTVTVGSISGTGTVTIAVAAGSCADVAGNPNTAGGPTTYDIIKAGQTITFPAIADQVATNTLGLSATASSGLPVSFTVGSGPATLSGGTNLSFSGAGSVSIVAGQAGDGNWNAAVAVTNTFRVYGFYALTIASLYGTATPPTGVYGRVEGTALTNSVTAFAPRGITQYVCVGWTLAGVVATNGLAAGSGTNVALVLTNSATLTWWWATNYWLDTGAEPHGSVDVTDSWQGCGSNVSITASATSYYHFARWTGDVPGGNVTNNPLVLLVDAPKAVTASFAENLTAHGAPEWWLAAHGWTNAFDIAETNDIDGDGMRAWEEYVAGTDPTNRASFLGFTAASDTAQGGQGFVVRWWSRDGKRYRLDRSTNLSSIPAFDYVVRTNILGVAPINTETDTNATGQRPYFYRVRVQ